MAEHSAIEWTNATWNPVTGCTKVSPGCKHCYAERLAERFQAAGSHRYRNGFQLTLHPDVLDLPLRWKKPKMIFVNSMSDLFHEEIPPEFLYRVFDVMKAASWHTFQILTKRAEYLRVVASVLPWSPNVWMGVSVEDQKRADERIPNLITVPAAVRFLSCEPLLGPVNLSKWLYLCRPDLITDPATGTYSEVVHAANNAIGAFRSRDAWALHWVIVGGESGPVHRPMDPQWARDIRDQCVATGVPYFFKQWGGPTPKSGGRLLDGRTWDEMPRPMERV